VDLDLEALELGARETCDEVQSYLDLESGQVVVIVKGEPDARLLKERVRRERKRYARVPPLGLSEERALLRDFLAEHIVGAGRDLLLRLVDEPGGFHGCLSALKADHDLWGRWERFECAGVRGSLLGWMAGLGVCPAGMVSVLTDD
jgi:hypothetical protein